MQCLVNSILFHIFCNARLGLHPVSNSKSEKLIISTETLHWNIDASRGGEYVTPTIIGPNSIYRDDVFGADSDVNFYTARALFVH